MGAASSTLADVIRAAARFGDTPFLRFVPKDSATVTDGVSFAEFVDQAARLATDLVRLGIGPDSRVALLARPDIDYVRVLAAITLTGATAFPVNHTFRAREIRGYLNAITCRYVYTDASTLPHLEAVRADLPALTTVLCRDAGAGVVRIDPAGSTGEPFAPRLIDPSQPGVVLHTSGTTGLPKGARHTHASYCAFLEWWARHGPRASDRIISFSPLYHQAGLLLQLFASLNVGATLTQLEAFSARSFWSLADDARATVSVLIPPVPSYLLAAPPSSADAAHTLEWAFLAGRSDHWREFQDRFGVAGHSGYASTEMTIAYLTGDRDAGPCADDRLAEPGYLCGRPVDGWLDVRVVDDDGVPVRGAAVGNIEARGGAMFSGYLDNPTASAGAFTADGWFRTGDSGYTSDAGDLYLLERTSELIRRSHEKISPGEIENALLDHPGIAEAAVVPVPDEYREQEIRAVVVLAPGTELTADEIFAHCRSQLADFKVPRYLEFRASIPRTSNFKIRKADLIADADPARWIDRLSAHSAS